VSAEVADRRGRDLQSFGAKERPLQLEISSIPAQFARRRNDPMTRNIRPAAVAHDVAHRSRGAGPSGGFSDIAVGRNIPDRNPANDSQDEVFEN